MTWIDYIPQQDALDFGVFFNLDGRHKLEDAIKDAKEYSATHNNCPVRVLCRERTVIWESESR